MTGYVVRCVGMPGWWTPAHPLPDVAGKYLERYDPAGSTETFASWTDDLASAKVYPTIRELHADWTAVNPDMPVRPNDGKPNRPLTMFSILVVPLEEVTP